MAWATDDDNNDDEGDGDDDDDHVEDDDDDDDAAFFMNPRRQGVTGKAWAATEARCHGKGLGSNGGKVSRKRLSI